MPNKRKRFADYIIDKPTADSNFRRPKQPATLFLFELVQLSDAVRHCGNKFPKKKNGDYTKDSLESLHRLCSAAHASVMGHFEAFQKTFFAKLFEASRLLKSFKADTFTKKLNEWGTRVDFARLHAYRGASASVGLVFADSLSGWHNPETVNKYYHGLVRRNLFSNDHVRQLNTLWQIRHSIVHTGGILTPGDAHKVPELARHAGKCLTFDHRFVDAVIRRFHGMVYKSVQGIEEAFRANLVDNLSDEEKAEVSDLFAVESSRPSWLPGNGDEPEDTPPEVASDDSPSHEAGSDTSAGS